MLIFQNIWPIFLYVCMLIFWNIWFEWLNNEMLIFQSIHVFGHILITDTLPNDNMDLDCGNRLLKGARSSVK